VITLLRDCDATRIPSGEKMVLPKGASLEVTQALGGTFTVQVDHTELVSIQGKDADALGKKPEDASPTSGDAEGKGLQERVWDQLKTCYDPEIPHNIVDLGLIYECKLSDLPAGPDQKRVDIKMTLTAPGCGMGDWLIQEVKKKLGSLSEIKECHVEMVFDPPWDRSKINPELKPYLGL
jgi:probable FeS assembly SUF system protein SufT